LVAIRTFSIGVASIFGFIRNAVSIAEIVYSLASCFADNLAVEAGGVSTRAIIYRLSQVQARGERKKKHPLKRHFSQRYVTLVQVARVDVLILSWRRVS
jgi:hypothetical protein